MKEKIRELLERMSAGQRRAMFARMRSAGKKGGKRKRKMGLIADEQGNFSTYHNTSVRAKSFLKNANVKYDNEKAKAGEHSYFNKEKKVASWSRTTHKTIIYGK